MTLPIILRVFEHNRWKPINLFILSMFILHRNFSNAHKPSWQRNRLIHNRGNADWTFLRMSPHTFKTLIPTINWTFNHDEFVVYLSFGEFVPIGKEILPSGLTRGPDDSGRVSSCHSTSWEFVLRQGFFIKSNKINYLNIYLSAGVFNTLKISFSSFRL